MSTSSSPRRELLAMALPAVVVVLVDWAFWGLRAEQAGWGVNIDGLALLAGFVVALAASGPSKSPDEPQASLLDAWIHRFGLASFGLLGASVCGAIFAYLRLGSISVGPELGSTMLGGRSVLVALALIVAPPMAWGLRVGVTRLPDALRIALCVASIAFSSWVTLHPEEPGARLEYLRASFHTIASLPPMTLEVNVERVTAAGTTFDYLAVGHDCVLRPGKLEPNRKISEQSASIPANLTFGGFAICPAIDIMEGGGHTYGVVADTTPANPGGQALFRIVDGRLETNPITNGLFLSPLPPSRKIDSIPSIRAPRGVVSDQDSDKGVVIKRDATSLERCIIGVRVDDALVHTSSVVFSGSGKLMQACGAVTVTRSESLGILNVDAPESGVPRGSAEPENASWLDGSGAESVLLERVAARVNTPKAWRSGALIGIGVGTLAFFVSLVALVRLRRLRGFVAAHHQGGGKLELADGGIGDAEAARALEVGEVFVRGALPTSRLPKYRAGAQETAPTLEVRTPAAVHLEWDRLSAHVMFASATALAFPLATAALMAAARLFGLGG